VPLLQDEAQHALDHRAEPHPGEPGDPPGQLGVEEPGGDHAYLAEAGKVLGGGVQHPLDTGERLAEPGQVGTGHGVDQRGARAGAAQLDEVGALSVAVAGRPFGVDGDGPGARGERGDHLGERGLVGDHGRNALTRLQQRDRRLRARGSTIVRRAASGGSQ